MIRSARLGDSPSAAISLIFKFNHIENSLNELLDTSQKQTTCDISIRPFSSSIFKNYLKIEKAKVMFECGLSSQNNIGMNEMQSVVESSISSLVLNEKVFGDTPSIMQNYIKAYTLTGLSGSLSEILPNHVNLDLYRNDPTLSKEIYNICNSNVLNLSADEINVLKKFLKPLSDHEIQSMRQSYLEAGISVLEWKSEAGLITQNGLNKKFDGLLTIQDNLKSHYMIGKVYDTMLENSKEHYLSEKINLMEISSKDTQGSSANRRSAHLINSRAESKFCAIRYYIIRHYSRVCLSSSQYLYQAMARLFTIWFSFGDLMTNPENSSKNSISSRFDMSNKIISNLANRIPSHNILVSFSQIVSCICHNNPKIVKSIESFIKKALADYPYQALWQLMAVYRSNYAIREKRCSEILKNAQNDSNLKSKVNLLKITKEAILLTDGLLKLSNHNPPRNVKTLSMLKDFPSLLKIGSSSSFIVPLQSSLIPMYPSFKQKNEAFNIPNTVLRDDFYSEMKKNAHLKHNFKRYTSNSSDNQSIDAEGTYTTASQQAASASYIPFPHDIPTIESLNDEILVMSSLQKPKKIVILGSDGISYAFLCKPKDDLRKDARQMEFNALINQVLSDDSDALKRSLKIKTYAVVPLNEDCGIIEWVPNTVSIQQTVNKMFAESNIQINSSVIRGLLNAKTKTPELHFINNILKKYPPVLYRWFMKQFKTPEEWIESRKTFANSAAVMSMVGYIVGLGDRHCENILLDQVTGSVLHVDFSCLFEKGTKLEVPERVPFRLTHNMVDAMGSQGYEGSFRTSCEITMRLLRTHRGALKSILDTFINDPLVEWSSLSSRKSENRHELIEEAARLALGKIGTKLGGFYNSSYIPVAGQVDELIKEATDPGNLLKMYIGWAPYI
ncbi:Serine/threonine-protein kinase atr [Smittium culicis]|uniref:non-specific serine/threonine protein kinase n=1 Tax=Smittium culicis TaxID=133412 RepID=A0A1R1XHE6_9FUNG|nr:Serine/threonine-protein kinase atr [Smittium culicis]